MDLVGGEKTALGVGAAPVGATAPDSSSVEVGLEEKMPGLVLLPVPAPAPFSVLVLGPAIVGAEVLPSTLLLGAEPAGALTVLLADPP